MRLSYHNPEKLAAPVARYSHAVRVELGDGALIFVCGQLPLNAAGTLVGEGDVTRQAEQVFENITEVLRANGATMDKVIQTTTFVTDIANLPKVNEVRARYFPTTAAPTSTTVEVNALARSEWLLEVEAIAAA